MARIVFVPSSFALGMLDQNSVTNAIVSQHTASCTWLAFSE